MQRYHVQGTEEAVFFRFLRDLLRSKRNCCNTPYEAKLLRILRGVNILCDRNMPLQPVSRCAKNDYAEVTRARLYSVLCT